MGQWNERRIWFMIFFIVSVLKNISKKRKFVPWFILTSVSPVRYIKVGIFQQFSVRLNAGVIEKTNFQSSSIIDVLFVCRQRTLKSVV